MRRVLVALLLVAGVLFMPVAASAGGSTAVSAEERTWGAGDWECTAKFVRSSSGIINETERSCQGGQDWPDLSNDVWLQFRPIGGKPNASCDLDGGLVTTGFIYVNSEPTLNDYFVSGQQYMTCVYLVNPVVVSDSVDSADSDGEAAAVPLSGRYRIDVWGTWDNTSHDLVDAEYVEQPPLYDTWGDGFPGLTGDWGDLMVEGGFVDWGILDVVNHSYAHTATVTDGSVHLRVYDDDPANPGQNWYGDNTGSLSYTVTYLGPTTP